MKYYIISGEASGDLHASNLVKELRKLDSSAEIRGWGGDLMAAQDVIIVKHYRDLAFMGFLEVVANLRTILRNIEFCKKDIKSYEPDAIILVDYPGFNLRIAEFAHKERIKVIYYISPQIWAWKQSRVKKIKKNVDRMLVILPFEKTFYSNFNYTVDFVGHPLLDAIDELPSPSGFSEKYDIPGKKIVALLPGSRKQEIAVMLPLMIKASEGFTDLTFVIAGAPSIPENFYKEYIADDNVSIIYNDTYELLKNSYAALVTSGTATLEAALFNVPEVVCYKGNRISYLIARRLIKVDYISLVNLVMNREVVKELIQDELTVAALREELKKILNPEIREKINGDYRTLKTLLGGKGASRRAAEIIYKDISVE